MSTGIIYTKTLEIASGISETVWPTGNRVSPHQHRFSVVGAGTADIQPIFKGQLTHKAETVLNDSIVLDLSGVDNFDISASGGAITVIYTGVQ